MAGQPYDRFLAERIFQPLEMKDTFFFVPADKASRVASVYTYETDGLKRVPMPQPKFPAPEGGLLSTAGDMARFHQMLLEKGITERAAHSLGSRRGSDDHIADRLYEGGLCSRSGSRLRLRGGARGAWHIPL